MKANKRILEILENILYWETCPEDYKEDIQAFLNKQIEPIPLTEEWLLKFGFIDISDDYDDVEKCYLLESLEVRYYSVIKARGVWMFGLEFEDFNTEIMYVHQLQNLYFALTGKELTVSN